MAAICASHPHGKKHDGHDHGPLKSGVAHEVGGKGGKDEFCNNTRAPCGKKGNLKCSASGWVQRRHVSLNAPENNECPGYIRKGFDVGRSNVWASGFNGFIFSESGDLIGKFHAWKQESVSEHTDEG